jgi:hypothetical protein
LRRHLTFNSIAFGWLIFGSTSQVIELWGVRRILKKLDELESQYIHKRVVEP